MKRPNFPCAGALYYGQLCRLFGLQIKVLRGDISSIFKF